MIRIWRRKGSADRTASARADAAAREWLRMRPVWIIWYAVLLHITWGCLLLASQVPYGATALHVYHAVPRVVLAAALFAASGLAMWGVTRRRPSWQGLAALLPQQAIMTFSAYAAVVAVAAAHYGDGVPRPRLFILADQVPALLTMMLHTAAVIEMHARWPVGTALRASLGKLDAESKRLRSDLGEKADLLRRLDSRPAEAGTAGDASGHTRVVKATRSPRPRSMRWRSP